jgi:prepilin-type N-terminal cleavage/methylation domain-containing protein
VRQAGFTIVELTIALAVMGILVVLGYPYVSTYLQAARLRAGAQELVTLIHGARQLAIARNTNVCVSLTGTVATYRTGVSATCAGGTLFVGSLTAADGTMKLQNTVQITAASASVTFSPLGAATTAATYTVHDPTSGHDLSVVVATTGRVRIQ